MLLIISDIRYKFNNIFLPAKLSPLPSSAGWMVTHYIVKGIRKKGDIFRKINKNFSENILEISYTLFGSTISPSRILGPAGIYNKKKQPFRVAL
jgi:hypothetical protein